MLFELESLKIIFRQPPLIKTNIFKRQNLAQNLWKLTFFFMDETPVTYDGPDEWSKKRILSYSDVAKRRKQEGGRGMIWVGLVD